MGSQCLFGLDELKSLVVNKRYCRAVPQNIRTHVAAYVFHHADTGALAASQIIMQRYAGRVWPISASLFRQIPCIFGNHRRKLHPVFPAKVRILVWGDLWIDSIVFQVAFGHTIYVNWCLIKLGPILFDIRAGLFQGFNRRLRQLLVFFTHTSIIGDVWASCAAGHQSKDRYKTITSIHDAYLGHSGFYRKFPTTRQTLRVPSNKPQARAMTSARGWLQSLASCALYSPGRADLVLPARHPTERNLPLPRGRKAGNRCAVVSIYREAIRVHSALVAVLSFVLRDGPASLLRMRSVESAA